MIYFFSFIIELLDRTSETARTIIASLAHYFFVPRLDVFMILKINITDNKFMVYVFIVTIVSY